MQKEKKNRLKIKKGGNRAQRKENEVRQNLRKCVFLSGLNRGESLRRIRYFLFAAAPVSPSKGH